MIGLSCKDYQEQLIFEDLIWMDFYVQEELVFDIDYIGEVLIVLMKFVNYYFSRFVIFLFVIKDVDFNLEILGFFGFEREKIEICYR